MGDVRPPVIASRRRFALSFALSVLARIPGLLGLVFILPALQRNLGVELYGTILSGFALGSILCLPFTGISYTARRLIGEAACTGTWKDEANIFCQSTSTAAILFFIFSFFSMTYLTFFPISNTFIFSTACLSTLLIGFFSLYDNVRVGYNDYYVSSALQFFMQSIIYSGTVLYFYDAIGPFSAILIVCGPYLLASGMSLVLLLFQRSYLLSGERRPSWRLLKDATAITGADASVSFALNMSVIGATYFGGLVFAGWYGTIARVFQSLFQAALTIVLPLAGHLRVRWSDLEPGRRLVLVRRYFAFALVSATAGGLIIAFGGQIYYDSLFAGQEAVNRNDYLAAGALFGSLLLFKMYSSVIYSVHAGASFALFVLCATCTAVLIVFLSAPHLDAHSALRLFCLLVSIPMSTIITIHGLWARWAMPARL